MQQQGEPQQVAPREVTLTTPTQGRGRGRGGRGRGRDQGSATTTPATQQQQQATNPSVPHLVTRLSAGTQPIVRPSFSYYVIDLVNMVTLFQGFARFIVSLARRGDWPLGSGYYCGLMFYALAAKLQRVGIATNQINPSNAWYLEVAGLELPTSVVTLIDQFGEKMDPSGVRIAPYVTNNLIAVMGRMAYLLSGFAIDCIAFNPFSQLWLDANKYNLMVQAYGALIFGRIAISRVAARLGISCSLGGVRSVDLNRSCLQMMIEYCINNNLPLPTAQEQAGVLANAQNNTTAGPLIALFDVGAVALVAGGNFTANFVAPFNEVRAEYSNAATLFPDGTDGYVSEASVTMVPGAWNKYYAEQVELAHRFNMSPVSVSASGSFAPTVVGSEEGNQMAGYSVVAGLTPLEWNLGLVIGADPTLIGRDGIPFNVSDRARRQARYSIPPIGMSYDNLTTAYIRESLRNTRM